MNTPEEQKRNEEEKSDDTADVAKKITEEHGNLGATEDEVSPVTAPEIVDDQDETSEETLDEIKEDMTGG